MDQQMSYFLPPITNTLPTGNCTLREVYRWITEDKSLETVTNELRAFIREGRIAEYRQLKQRQLPFVTPHGVFSRRKSDALISASGLVVVDIDHLASLEEAEQLRNHLFEDPYLGTRLAFVSSGGLGVKLFIPGDETVRWAMSYIQLLYADIAPTYAEYVQLAFAIATDCGEAGRSDFISLCEPSPKFNALHANKLFSSALRTGNQNVHLGTAFHLAKLAGVEIGFKFQGFTKPFSSHTRVSTYNTADTVDQAHETSDRETEANDAPLHIGSEPYTSLPRLVPGYPWPSLLRDILGFADNAEQRDILLLTALTALGATLGKTVRCLYGMHWIYPCIQLFVIAPPASGKGIMAWLRKFIEPIHREIRQQVDLAMKQYRQDLAAYHALGKEKAKMEMPQMPKNSMFIISGNNTGTGILQNIIDSDGTGIIFETEADTITTAIGGDYGHWSDTLRNAFDHAGLSFNRRTDNEYRECDSTFLSMVLSGTPGQVAPLIPSGENGLFSREVFYYKSQIREWIDQFSVDEVDAEKEFHQMGYEWKATIDQLKCRGTITLRLDERQQAAFNDSFVRLFLRARQSNGQEMNSSVVRLAINLVRFMEVVAMLRALEQPELLLPAQGINSDNLKDKIIGGWELHITDDDFAALLTMAEPLYLHATHILSFLPTGEITSRGLSEKDSLLSSMPDEFTTVQWMETAEHANIPKNTAKTWLRRLCDSGALLHGEHKGIYLKPI